MIDVFIRRQLYYHDPLRSAFWLATMARWQKDPCARVTQVMGSPDIRAVRLECEQLSRSDIYIVSDDDLLPMGKNWVARVTEILSRYKDYGAISTLSVIERENTLQPPNPTDELYEAHALGAPLVLRKGLLSGIGEMTMNSECMVIYEHLKSNGWKEGIVNPHLDLRHMHCGSSFSTTEGQRWGY